MTKALLVIDLQEEYFGKDRNRERFGKFEDAKIEEFIKRVNKHIDAYEAAGNEVIYTQEVLPNTIVFRKFFGHSIKGTKGIDLYKGLKIVGTSRFTKQFGDAFSNPALKRYIKEKGITEVEIAGIDSTKCAYLTAKGAVKYGLKTSMLIDAIDTIYPHDVEKCEKDLKSRGVIYR